MISTGGILSCCRLALSWGSGRVLPRVVDEALRVDPALPRKLLRIANTELKDNKKQKSKYKKEDSLMSKQELQQSQERTSKSTTNQRLILKNLNQVPRHLRHHRCLVSDWLA